MNYTANYHLPQWVKSDRIMMEDFNDMNSSIEEGLTAAVGTAGDARDTAAQAKQIAQQAAAAKPYVVGSYRGTNSEITVTLGFRPSFLIISGVVSNNGETPDTSRHAIMTGGGVASDKVQITDTGFIAKARVNFYPDLCESGRTYNYIAFR